MLPDKHCQIHLHVLDLHVTKTSQLTYTAEVNWKMLIRAGFELVSSFHNTLRMILK